MDSPRREPWVSVCPTEKSPGRGDRIGTGQRGAGQRRAFAADAEGKLTKQLESIRQISGSLRIEDDAFMKLALDGALDVAKTRLAWMKRLRTHLAQE